MDNKPLFQAWVMNTEFNILAYDINNHMAHMPADNTRQACLTYTVNFTPTIQRRWKVCIWRGTTTKRGS